MTIKNILNYFPGQTSEIVMIIMVVTSVVGRYFDDVSAPYGMT